jgi:deazaflavin-dependent oxidoreductase (nitroreductase family)
MTDLTKYSGQSTVKLTTVGRKSGQPRSVTIWFVIADARRMHVQHSSRAAAQWYKNLLQNPEVQIDFGDGPIRARAVPIKDPAGIANILRQVRSKYMMAWLFRLLGWGTTPQVATIELTEGNA